MGGRLHDAFQSAKALVATLRRWLHRDEPAPPPETPEGGNAAPALKPLAYGLCGLLAVAMAYLLWTAARGRRRAARPTGPATDPAAGG